MVCILLFPLSFPLFLVNESNVKCHIDLFCMNISSPIKYVMVLADSNKITDQPTHMPSQIHTCFSCIPLFLVNTYYISLLSQEWAHKQYIAKHLQGPSQQWGNFYYFRMQNIRFVFNISISASCKSHKKFYVLWTSNSIILVKDGCSSKKGLTIACA